MSVLNQKITFREIENQENISNVTNIGIHGNNILLEKL